MAKTSNLKDRLKNPNKDFDSLVWRPKSRFWRRFMARYVNYVEIAAYIFVALIIAAVIYTWTMPSVMWTQASNFPQMKPDALVVKSPFDGIVDRVLVDAGTEVKQGDVLGYVRGSAGEGEIGLVAGSAGIVYPKMSEVDAGAAGSKIRKNDVLFEVVDFSVFTMDVELSKHSDSVDIGDVADIEPVGYSENKKSGLMTTIINLRHNDKRYPAKVAFQTKHDLIDSIASSVLEQQIVIKNCGVFTVKSVKEGAFTMRYEGVPGSPDLSQSTVIGVVKPLRGELVSGVRSLEIEKLTGFPAETKEKYDRWTKNYLGQMVSFDSKTYSPSELTGSKMRLKLSLESPLTEKTPFNALPKEVRKTAVDGGEMKVKGVVKLMQAPLHIQIAARKLYESHSKPQYLNAVVNVRAYSTTWGKRLLKQ